MSERQSKHTHLYYALAPTLDKTIQFTSPLELVATPPLSAWGKKMKIYLGFTVAGNRFAVGAARGIHKALRSLGHEVLTSHLLDDNAWEADRRKPPQEIFARDMDWLAACDIFVAEVSGSSFGLGFETGYILGSSAKQTRCCVT